MTLLLCLSGVALSDKLPEIKLKTLTTTTGERFTELTVTNRTEDSITIRHSSGVATLPVEKIAQEQLKQLGFDPAEVEALLRARETKEFRLLSYKYNGNPEQQEKMNKLGAYVIHGNTGVTCVFQIDPEILGNSKNLTFTFKNADIPHAATKRIVRLVKDGKLLISTKGAKRGEFVELSIPRSSLKNDQKFEVTLLGGKDVFMLEHSKGQPLVSLTPKPLSEEERAEIAKAIAQKAEAKKKLETLRKSSRPRTFIVDRVTRDGGVIAWGTTVSHLTMDKIPRTGGGEAAPKGQVSYGRSYYLDGVPKPSRFSQLDYVGGIFAEDGTHNVGNGVNLTKWVFLGLKKD